MNNINVVYYSRYFNVNNFVDFYMGNETCYSISKEGESKLPDGNKCILIMPTYEPEYLLPAYQFLEDRGDDVVAIVGSGDRNYSELFLYSVVEMAMEYNIPIIGGFDGVGTSYEATVINSFLQAYRKGESTEDIRTMDIQLDVQSYLNYKEMSGYEWKNPISKK